MYRAPNQKQKNASLKEYAQYDIQSYARIIDYGLNLKYQKPVDWIHIQRPTGVNLTFFGDIIHLWRLNRVPIGRGGSSISKRLAPESPTACDI